MKQQLVTSVRNILPSGVVRHVENIYRKNRVRFLSASYGNPARHLRVIAVTGTNGKTTTLNFLNEILKEAGHSTAMFTTAVIEIDNKRQLNDLNATVASTKRMQQFFRDARHAKADFVLLEVTSHSLDQYKLAGVPIELAVMTNLTQDHLDYHKTMEEYAKAKGKLFARKPEFIVLNRDDEWFEFFDKYSATNQKITYGKHAESEARIDNIKLYKKGTEASVTIDHQTKLDLATALPGEFNAYNMVAAVGAAYLLGLKLNDIVEGVANLEDIPGRFERPVTSLPYDLVVDYAHTPDALEKLLKTVKEISKNRVILVFGSCGDRDRTKRPIMGKIAAELADRIILTDEESYNEPAEQIRNEIMVGIEEHRGGATKTDEIADRRQAIEKAMSIAGKGDTVLITGLGHETFRIIDGAKIPWNDSEIVREIAKSKK